MIKHVVCFKLNDNSQELKDEAKKVLLSMIGKVSLFETIEVGTDFLCSPRSFDVILITTFKSKELLDAYQKDDYHCSVVKTYMHSHTSQSVAVDFEF